MAARRWKSQRIGLDALKALQTASESCAAARAVFIGLGAMTDQARPCAQAQAITVWQLPELARAVLGLRLDAAAAPAQSIGRKEEGTPRTVRREDKDGRDVSWAKFEGASEAGPNDRFTSSPPAGVDPDGTFAVRISLPQS